MASAKKRGKGSPHGGEPAEDYYKLKTQAVEDLVGAEASNSPPVSEGELRQYHRHGSWKVPNWLKVNFIKAWFPGAVCFFFLWGLGTYVADLLDLLFITAIALGIVTDLLTNNVLHLIETTPGANDRWMMFPQKRFATFFLNMFYSAVLLFLVYLMYNVLNFALIALLHPPEGTVPLGVEPILFGVFYMLFDDLFLFVKHKCVQFFSARKRNTA